MSGTTSRRPGTTRLLLLLVFCLHNAFADTADNGLNDQEPLVACQEQLPASFSVGSLTFVLDVDFRSLKATVNDILQTMLMLRLAHSGYQSYQRMAWPGLTDTLIQVFYTGWQSYLIFSSRMLFAGHCVDKGVTYLRKMAGNCALWQEIPVYIEDPELARRVYLKVVNRGGASVLVIRVLRRQPDTVAPQPVNYRAIHNLANWMEEHFIHTMEVTMASDPETTANGSEQLELRLNGREGWTLPFTGSDVPWLQEPCQFGQEAYSRVHTILSPQWLDWITESLKDLEQPSEPGGKENSTEPPHPASVTRPGSATTAISSDADEGVPYWIIFANADIPYIQITRPSPSLPDYDSVAISVLAASHSSQIVWRDQDVYDTFWSVQQMQAVAGIRIPDARPIQLPAIETEDISVTSELTDLTKQTGLSEQRVEVREQPGFHIIRQVPAPAEPEWTEVTPATVVQIPPAQTAEKRTIVLNRLPDIIPVELPLVNPPGQPSTEQPPIAQSAPTAGSPEWFLPPQQKQEKKAKCSGPCKGRYPVSQLNPVSATSQKKICDDCRKKENRPAQQRSRAGSKAIERARRDIGKTQYDVRSAQTDDAINLIYAFIKDPDEEKIRIHISAFADIFYAASIDVLGLFSLPVLNELKYHKKNRHKKNVEHLVIEQTKDNVAIYLKGLNRLVKFYKAVTLESIDRLRKKESEAEPLKTPFTMGMILFYLEENYSYISRALSAFGDREEEQLLRELFNTVTVIPFLLDTLNFLDEGRMQWTLHYSEDVYQMVGLSEQKKWEELLPTLSQSYRSNDQKYLLRVFTTWLGQGYYSRSLYLFLSSRASLKIPDKTMADILSGLPALLRSSIKIRNDDYCHKAFSLFTQIPGKAKSFLKTYLQKNTAFSVYFYTSLEAYLYYIHERYHRRITGNSEQFTEQGYPTYFDEDIRRLDLLLADESPVSKKQSTLRIPDRVLVEHRRRLNRQDDKGKRQVESAEQAQKRRFERYLKYESEEKDAKVARVKKKLEKSRNLFFTLDKEAEPETEYNDEPLTTDQKIELAAMDSPWEVAMNEVAESYAQKDFAYSIQCIDKAIDLSSDDEQFVLASYEKASLYANELFRQTSEAVKRLNSMRRYESIAAQLDTHFIEGLINRPELSLKERLAILKTHNIQFASREDRDHYISHAIRLHREVSHEIASWSGLVSGMLETVEQLNERLELLDTVDQLRVEGAFVSEAMARATTTLNRLKHAPARVIATEQKTKELVTALGVYGANSGSKKTKTKAKAKKKQHSLGKTYQTVKWVIPDLSPVDALIRHLASPSGTVPDSRATAMTADSIVQTPDDETVTIEPSTATLKQKTQQPKQPSFLDLGDIEFYLPKDMWWVLEK